MPSCTASCPPWRPAPHGLPPPSPLPPAGLQPALCSSSSSWSLRVPAPRTLTPLDAPNPSPRAESLGPDLHAAWLTWAPRGAGSGASHQSRHQPHHSLPTKPSQLRLLAHPTACKPIPAMHLGGLAWGIRFLPPDTLQSPPPPQSNLCSCSSSPAATGHCTTKKGPHKLLSHYGMQSGPLREASRHTAVSTHNVPTLLGATKWPQMRVPNTAPASSSR